MRRITTTVLVALLAVAGLAGGVAPAAAENEITANPQFTEVSDLVGLGGVGFQSQHIHGLGVIWIDYDGDDWPDLFVTNGKGLSAHLFHNDGGTFTQVDELLPALPDVELMGAIFADYDRDGDDDIHIFTDHEQLNFNIPELNPLDGPQDVLLQNQWVENGGTTVPGTPLFVDVAAAAGVNEQAAIPFGPTYDGYRSTSGSFFDYDRDGWLDLFTAHWSVLHPHEEAVGNKLYRNAGDGTFDDVTAATGVDDGVTTAARRSTLAGIAAHLDGDIWPDIWEANVADPPPDHYDRVLLNVGGTGFVDATALSPGLGNDTMAAMGHAIGDPNLDGAWDVYITDNGGNAYYIGNGDGTFVDDSAAAHGIGATNSWGTNFFDADHDGDEDLFVATMVDIDQLFYENDGTGFFTDVSASAGFAGRAGEGRGSALADYDRDGDLDLAVVNTAFAGQGELMLFRNDTPDAGHRLQVRLTPTAATTNPGAIGTVLRASATGVGDQIRQVTGGNSIHSQDEPLVHFGLGDATVVDELVVAWPSGLVDVFTGIAADQIFEAVEGASAPPVVARYEFDGNALDSSGNGNHGTTAGNPNYGPGLDGRALRLDGVDDSVAIASVPDLEGDTVAVSTWINLLARPTGTQMIAVKTDGAFGYRFGFVNRKLRLELMNGPGVRSSVEVGAEVVPLRTWVHLSATYDGTTAALWVDGDLAASTAIPGYAVGSTAAVVLGADQLGARRLRGALDQVEIRSAPIGAAGECVRAGGTWDGAACIDH